MNEALERLYARRTFGIKLGLHVQEAFMRLLGNPEQSYGIIHVAGTNGKGSVCAYVESALRKAGYRTGLYVSPHLVRFNERICVGGEPISDRDLDGLVADTEKLADQAAKEVGQEPTFFECATAMGLEYFKRRGVQVAVVETGMGGRLDATNVVTPLVSVITRISIEHTAYLGKDIKAIAGEKAGIIKKGRPVVCGATDDKALDVIRRVAKEKKAPLVEAAQVVSARLKSMSSSGQKVEIESSSESYGTLTSRLIGGHQVENLATAIAVLETLRERCSLEISSEAIKKGIAETTWPGRLQTLKSDPLVLLDGAHNPGAAEALVKALNTLAKKRPVGLVLGMCGDKDVVSFLKRFGKMVKRLWIVPIKSERNMPSSNIMSAARRMGWVMSETSLAQGLKEAETWAVCENGVVCVTGSLFLVGEVLDQRKD